MTEIVKSLRDQRDVRGDKLKYRRESVDERLNHVSDTGDDRLVSVHHELFYNRYDFFEGKVLKIGQRIENASEKILKPSSNILCCGNHLGKRILQSLHSKSRDFRFLNGIYEILKL